MSEKKQGSSSKENFVPPKSLPSKMIKESNDNSPKPKT